MYYLLIKQILPNSPFSFEYLPLCFDAICGEFSFVIAANGVFMWNSEIYSAFLDFLYIQSLTSKIIRLIISGLST